MGSSIEQALVASVLRILRPLVRVLLSHGMAYGTFAEIARRAFVDEGVEHMRRNGRRPTTTGVAALTGLTRKETGRLRDAPPDDGGEAGQRYNRAVRVISGWVGDPEFTDRSGQPRELSLEGNSGSFRELVKKYSGDITPAAMLSLLETSHNVSCDGERVTLRERAYIPTATPLDKIHILGTDVAELIGTISHNLEAPAGARRFQRKVSHVGVPTRALPLFRDMSNRKSQQLLEDYHAWLSSQEMPRDGEGDDATAYVAVGIYYFEETGEEGEP